MQNRKLLCFLLVAVCSCAANVIVPEYRRNEIPQRCIENTLTSVTCSDVSEDALLAHPDDCQLFYYCVGELPICRQCPAGLHFNPSKHVCDFPNRAGCRLPLSARSRD